MRSLGYIAGGEHYRLVTDNDGIKSKHIACIGKPEKCGPVWTCRITDWGSGKRISTAILGRDDMDKMEAWGRGEEPQGVEFPQYTHRQIEREYINAIKRCISLEQQLTESNLLASAAGVENSDAILETFGFSRVKEN